MNKKNVPEIRFSEFNNEWKEEKINNIVSYKTSNLTMSSVIYNGKYYVYDANQKIGKTNSYVSDQNYISIIKDGAGVGRMRILPALTNILGTMGAILPKNLNINFLESILNKVNIAEKTTGTTIPHIYFKDYKYLEIFIPEKNESTKIGEFLKNIDDLITKTEKQYSHYKNIKEALLNKMFPIDYSNVPKIRFKGFEDDWNVESLGNVGTFRSAGVDKIFRNNDKSVYMINFMDVYNKKTINRNNYKTLMRTTATIQEFDNCNLIKGDILITPSSETVEDIGIPLTIKETLKNVVYSYHLIRFRPKFEFFDIYFSDYVLTSEFVRSQMLYKAQGVQRVVLNKPDFEKLNIKFPEKISEQTKIGELFKNLDELIILTKKKHEKLKNIKNALLDKMFC